MAAEGAASTRGKPDPNVQLPAAVRQAAERSEQLMKEAAEAKKNRPPDADAPVQVSLQPSPPNPGVTMARFDPNNPQPPSEPQRQQPQAPPPQPQPLQPPQDPPNWEHQFQSLKGRYDRAEQDNKRLAGQIGDMQRLIAAMNAPTTPPQRQGPQQQEGSGVRFSGPITGRPPPKRVTEKEIQDYGADLIDVMGRRAMEVADNVFLPTIGQYEARLAQLERQIGGVRQTVEYDAQSRMYQQLDRELPNWKQINSHPDFVGWLQMPDPLSGQIRHDLLAQAYNSQQGNRVMEFFRRFLNEQASFGPANGGGQPGNGALTANSYATTPQVNLMDLAAPGRAKTGQTSVTPDKPTFTVAEIKQFYTDSANGKYAGREQEYNQIQQEIFAAGREGRVVQQR